MAETVTRVGVVLEDGMTPEEQEAVLTQAIKLGQSGHPATLVVDDSAGSDGVIVTEILRDLPPEKRVTRIILP